MGMQAFFSRRSLLAGTAAVFSKIAAGTFGVATGARGIPFRREPACDTSPNDPGPPRVFTRYHYDADGRVVESKFEWLSEERLRVTWVAYAPDEVSPAPTSLPTRTTIWFSLPTNDNAVGADV